MWFLEWLSQVELALPTDSSQRAICMLCDIDEHTWKCLANDLRRSLASRDVTLT